MNETTARRPFQFRLSSALIAMVVLSLLVGGGLWYWKRYVLNISAELERMDSTDANVDVNDAWGRGDFRFLGIYGIGLTVPGVDEAHWEKYGVNRLRFTSDFSRSGEESRLLRKTKDYAAEYNRLLLKKIMSTETNAKP